MTMSAMMQTQATWIQYARCRPMSLDLFFPPSRRAKFRVGRQACGACPVRAECLAAALYEEWASQRSGLRGGVDPAGRWRIQAWLLASYGEPDPPLVEDEETTGERACFMCGTQVYPEWIAGRKNPFARHFCSVQCLLQALRQRLPEVLTADLCEMCTAPITPVASGRRRYKCEACEPMPFVQLELMICA